VQQRQSGGTLTTYAYDDLNRQTGVTITNSASGHLVFAEHYDLDNDGSRKDAIDTRYNADGGGTISGTDEAARRWAPLSCRNRLRSAGGDSWKMLGISHGVPRCTREWCGSAVEGAA
jgi:hypothetical protein